jgi:hypothetical protein
MPRSSEWFFPSGLPTKIMYGFLISPKLAIRPAHLTLLDLVTLIICGGRSQQPSGLRQVLSTTAWTLGSQVRILLGARICVRVFLCCVVLCR